MQSAKAKRRSLFMRVNKSIWMLENLMQCAEGHSQDPGPTGRAEPLA